MKDKSVLVIGAGNIGRILIRRLLLCCIRPNHLFVYDVDPEQIRLAVDEFGVRSISLESSEISDIDFLMLASPPDTIQEILHQLNGKVNENQVIISFAAAVSLEQLQAMGPKKVHYARVMPNAMSMIGRGMNPVAYTSTTPKNVRAFVEELLIHLGESIEIDDEQMNWFVGLSGAAMRSLLPALEGMIQAGVEAGFPESDSRRIAGQVMLGTASMALYTQMSMEEIKALTPMRTVDESALKEIFLEAARNSKSKMDALQEKLRVN